MEKVKREITHEMLKKIANNYKLPVAVGEYNDVIVFSTVPELDDYDDGDGGFLYWIGEIIHCFDLGLDYVYKGWWPNSITLPDGWDGSK